MSAGLDLISGLEKLIASQTIADGYLFDASIERVFVDKENIDESQWPCWNIIAPEIKISSKNPDQLPTNNTYLLGLIVLAPAQDTDKPGLTGVRIADDLQRLISRGGRYEENGTLIALSIDGGEINIDSADDGGAVLVSMTFTGYVDTAPPTLGVLP